MKYFNTYFLNTIKSKYAKFDGRATRSEYWYFILFYFLVLFIILLIDRFVINPMLGMTYEEAKTGGLLQVFYTLSLLIPYLSLSVRRLHDIKKSGWWLLIGLIPIIGSFILIYFYIQDSKD